METDSTLLSEPLFFKHRGKFSSKTLRILPLLSNLVSPFAILNSVHRGIVSRGDSTNYDTLLTPLLTMIVVISDKERRIKFALIRNAMSLKDDSFSFRCRETCSLFVVVAIENKSKHKVRENNQHC